MNVSLPDVPPRDRGELLGQILNHVGGASFERLDLCLDSCRHAWPRAFEAGAPGLDGLARPLAEALVVYRPYPEHWLERLRRVLDRLGVTSFPGLGFEPDSLAAEVVAATLRLPGEDYGPWDFRKNLLDQDEAWRILAVDARRELLAAEPARAPAVIEFWDKNLEKTRTTGRFFELLLNVCDGPRLAAVVSARAADLKNLGVLPWWGRDSADDPEARDDLREAFARLAPLAPLREGALASVPRWMQGPRASAGPTSYLADIGLHPLDGDDPEGARRGADLSPLGSARWRCIEALSIFQRPWYDARMRWDLIIEWTAALPLEWLSADDRHRFVSWIILGLDEFDSVQVARLAKWLARSGMDDADRLANWADELAGLVEVSDAQRLGRVRFVGELRVELKTVVVEAKEGRRKPGRTGSA